MGTRIAIVGAGPKAAAIAARAAVLKDRLINGEVPEVHIFERDHVGCAWDGAGAYSSGFLELCTPFEKDIGFPYRDPLPSTAYKASVAAALFERFSFGAFLVAEKLYGDWVDRGRAHPTHKLFSKYLQWVVELSGAPLTEAHVERIESLPAGGWRLHHSGGDETFDADAVVLTGPGKARRISESGVPDGRQFDAATFWNARDEVLAARDTIAVAGDGGAAGAIIAWLAEAFEETDVTILSVSPLGTLLPRGDGHAERRWFSNPEEWAKLKLEDRQRLIDRTEAGVVSLRNKDVIDRASNVRYRPGKITMATWRKHDLSLTVEYDGVKQTVAADYLVSAIGFDPWSLLDLVEHPAKSSFDAGKRKAAAEGMLEDLSLPPAAGFGTGLHMPNVAALTRGPGMGNLNSLGLMAAAIVDGYVS